MPRKVRELRAEVRREGFINKPERDKGSHTWWEHPLLPEFPVNISGNDGDDAQPYQEKQVREVLRLLHEKQRQQQKGQP